MSFPLAKLSCSLHLQQRCRVSTVALLWHDLFSQSDLCRTEDITDEASAGEHELHCELMKDTKDPKGGTEFRLIAVDAA